jgi:hypothetical protein
MRCIEARWVQLLDLGSLGRRAADLLTEDGGAAGGLKLDHLVGGILGDAPGAGIPFRYERCDEKALTHRFLAIIRRFNYLPRRNDSASLAPRSSELTTNGSSPPSSIINLQPPMFGRRPGGIPDFGPMDS